MVFGHWKVVVDYLLLFWKSIPLWHRRNAWKWNLNKIPEVQLNCIPRKNSKTKNLTSKHDIMAHVATLILDIISSNDELIWHHFPSLQLEESKKEKKIFPGYFPNKPGKDIFPPPTTRSSLFKMFIIDLI